MTCIPADETGQKAAFKLDAYTTVTCNKPEVSDKSIRLEVCSRYVCEPKTCNKINVTQLVNVLVPLYASGHVIAYALASSTLHQRLELVKNFFVSKPSISHIYSATPLT